MTSLRTPRHGSQLTALIACLGLAAAALTGCIHPSAEDATDQAEEGAPSAAAPSPDPTAIDEGAAAPDLLAAPVLGPQVEPAPSNSEPWAAMAELVEGDTIFFQSDFLGEATPDMWQQGAGISAYDLTSGEQLWSIDYTDPALKIDTEAQPEQFGSAIVSNQAGQLAVLITAMDCADEECAAETEEDYTLATVDLATGEIQSALSGAGAFPMLVAFKESTVLLAPDWEHFTGLDAAALDADPVWTADSFDASTEAVSGDYVFTTGGWLSIATGQPGHFITDLNTVDFYTLVNPGAAVTAVGQGDDHLISLVDLTTDAPTWQQTVPLADAESQSLYAAASTIVLAVDSETDSRIVALDRATGEVAWEKSACVMMEHSPNWLLLSDPEGEKLFVVDSATGQSVADIDPGPEFASSVALGTDLMIVSSGSTLEARSLVDPSDDALWSIDTPEPDMRVAIDLGRLLLVDDLTGTAQTIAAA